MTMDWYKRLKPKETDHISSFIWSEYTYTIKASGVRFLTAKDSSNFSEDFYQGVSEIEKHPSAKAHKNIAELLEEEIINNEFYKFH